MCATHHNSYPVVELFDSIEGEGHRSGQPATFVRFAGCNLRCSYCDTAYALFNEPERCEFRLLTQFEIMERLNTNYHRVTLTGGEPLIQPHIADLTEGMVHNDFEVNIETNGAVPIEPLRRKIGNTSRLFFTIDYKLPSSGMEAHMLPENFRTLLPHDVVKFVVGNDTDIARMKEVMADMQTCHNIMPHVYVGAVFGQMALRHLAETILHDPLFADAHLQVQLHKIVWSPTERGV